MCYLLLLPRVNELDHESLGGDNGQHVWRRYPVVYRAKFAWANSQTTSGETVILLSLQSEPGMAAVLVSPSDGLNDCIRE